MPLNAHLDSELHMLHIQGVLYEMVSMVTLVVKEAATAVMGAWGWG